MKTIKYLFFVTILTIVGLTSCSKDEPVVEKESGTLSVLFDNRLGDKPISIKEAGNKSYDYKDANGQDYNISLYAYYISEIQVLGDDGVVYSDPMKVSANADEVSGYYHVNSTKQGSNVITLKDVKAGKYNKIRFVIGVKESGVQEGAAGGVLDPAKGAWFWNWNAGYIGFGVEGNAANSGQEYVDFGNGSEVKQGTFAVHIGGWKDVTPPDGQTAKFVNNVKTIELDFDSAIKIEKGVTPEAHINVNFDKLLTDVDFSKTFAIHRPDLGRPFAEKLSNVFELDHVHQ